jgi:FAD/FMN-containing dehydrogenase
VLAFDPVRQAWITAAHATPHGGLRIPRLEGELVVEPAALEEAADDFGHIIHRTPIAVLRPGSPQDVVQLVRYANRHGLQVAMRGQGHSTFGQAQAQGGVVIDSRTLNRIHSIGASGAVVDAGVQWIALLQASLERDLTPPVLTDYLGLSVGGTLSVGGIGGASHRYGLQIDNVLELQVVTGKGELLTCSPSAHSGLFHAVLGGLGQCAIIVRATIMLVPAQKQARVYRLWYRDLAVYTRDQRRVVLDERFDYLEGQVVPAERGRWRYMLEAAVYYTPPTVPNDAALLAGLQGDPASLLIEEFSYFDWQNRLAPLVEDLQQTGAWFVPHPFFDIFLPSRVTDRYVAGVLADLTLADTGQGPVLLYPFKKSKLKQPFLEVPDEEIIFLFDILRFAVPPQPTVVSAMVAENRALFEQARALGAKRYPIGAMPFTRADWREHYGIDWGFLLLQKRRFDPRHVLTPGQGIFVPAEE